MVDLNYLVEIHLLEERYTLSLRGVRFAELHNAFSKNPSKFRRKNFKKKVAEQPQISLERAIRDFSDIYDFDNSRWKIEQQHFCVFDLVCIIDNR